MTGEPGEMGAPGPAHQPGARGAAELTQPKPGPTLTFGLPRMHKEPGERRDFLPWIVAELGALGCSIFVETGIGSAMGYTDEDYRAASPLVQVVDERTAFAQDVVLTLRAPEDRFHWMRPGATLIAMLHLPTRPGRVRRLTQLGLQAISLDSIVDDQGRRLVENMRAVGWNGVEAAFDALARTYPPLTDPGRPPIHVTVMGAGTVAKHAVEAATKFGNLERNQTFAEMNLPGVVVSVVGRNVTGDATEMQRLFGSTDILIDATQRSDTVHPLIPNSWLACLPRHAVICDLVVDPYVLDVEPPTVRSIEGIPQGDLDQWTFFPNDPAWDRQVPASIPTRHRRTVVSCYSWPGLHPEIGMRHYEWQLQPLLATLVERGGVQGLRSDRGMLERALRRACLRSWVHPVSSPTHPSRNNRPALDYALRQALPGRRTA